MKIFLTNDDGIYADGIRILAEVLQEAGHQVFIVAPDRERSATGHSITILEPIRAIKVNINKDITAYKVSGTPADCVKLGLEKLIDFTPDLLISGINNGSNLAFDVLYSGTVSAAIEGWIMGLNSIAISLARKEKYNFQTAAYFLADFLEKEDLSVFKEKILLNINVPDQEQEDIRGVKICKLGTSLYEESFVERLDPAGRKYYWLAGSGNRKGLENTDIWAVENNYIAITPLKLQLDDQDLIDNWPGKDL
ncbi:MAG TPA: 5'/3'-nucleotidase SurE [Halanaerobiaceae bacterium]|mgnify:CR=1 FL=1|nr:5'/3'-nucleotidase SurE [Bacillota bacterium]HHU92240.1 5'/3'-nucleotidase SurE [Halanaerobiaceae bacterium]